MKKLNAKQLLVLPKGKYHDGNGLYISIYSHGKGKWTFRYRINKKSRESPYFIYSNQPVADFDSKYNRLVISLGIRIDNWKCLLPYFTI